MTISLVLSKFGKMTISLDSPKVSKMSNHLRSCHLSSSYPKDSHLSSSYLRSNHSAAPKTSKYIYKLFLCYSMKMLNQSLKELRLIAENRNMNGYQSMPKDKLLRIITKGDRKSLFFN